MDKRDAALQLSCPSVIVPRFSELEPATKPGERLLIASNGVFLEVTRQWARFVRKVGNIGIPVPYGECSNSTQLKSPRLPRNLLAQFNEMARENSKVEIGAGIVWNECTNEYRLMSVETLTASGAHLKYRPPALSAGDHLVIDCHSHGSYPAIFSETDDIDDKWCVKVSYVVGNCGSEQQSTASRLCIKGIFEEFEMEN